MSAKIIALSEAKAEVLQKLLRAMEPVVDDLGRINTVILGLRLADGSSRTVKILATTLEDSAPPEQGGGGGLPSGGTDGQVLTKQSSTDGDADWEDPAGGGNYRVLTAAMSVAGIVPTTTEISTALAAAYTNPDPDLVPANGDLVLLNLSGVPKFGFAIRTAPLTASGAYLRSFVVNSTTYYAVGWHLGLY